MPKFPEQEPSLNPYWSTADGRHVRLYHGNVTDVLARLPEKSIHCVVTSPPYWGLRDYKAGDDEIGREKTPVEYVARMVKVFQGVRRVLRDDGTVWLNLGDSYSAGGWECRRVNKIGEGSMEPGERKRSEFYGIPSGNLVGIPWRVALALQADGWVLRQDVIWHKPSPMPESVRNRCTKAHEYVFLFAKSKRYFYDAEAIKEKTSNRSQGQRTTKGYNTAQRYGAGNGGNGGLDSMADRLNSGEVVSSNKRSVWTISSNGYEGAHFAVFPPKLIEPMIRAGTSEKGCCSMCAAPYKRVIDRFGSQKIKGPSEHKRDRSFRSSRNGVDSTLDGEVGTYKTVGWEPGCACNADVVPCTVLDPFIGSGTTCEVSIELGRTSVGIDLSDRYLKNNAIPRIEGALLRRADTANLIERKRTAFKSNGGKLGILKQ